MTEAKLELHDDNHLETWEQFFHISDSKHMQRAKDQHGNYLLIFNIDGTQSFIVFTDEKNRDALFKEIIARKRALALGKEAFIRYLKQQKKAAV